jgi:hypothetical protein
MAVLRYDIRNPDGAFPERRWRPIDSPIHDGGRHLLSCCT